MPAATIRYVVEHQALEFLPIPDNGTLVTSPGRARAQGHFARVPIMCGTTGQEARDFEVTENNTKKFLQEVFGNITPQIIPAVEAAYQIGQPELATSYDVNTQIVTDFAADCVSPPAQFQAVALSFSNVDA